MAYDPQIPEEYLKQYYQRIFPYELFYNWLSYGNIDNFSKREISFTLHGDTYLRYLSFSDASEFKTELQRYNPVKIDIGAVYNVPPKMKKTSSSVLLVPQSRELVFDIDLTDYDDVRFCCSKDRICTKCWQLMVMAVKVIDVSLQEDFGFRNILWVYSGRRGIHCWVADEDARCMTSEERVAIVSYLKLVKGIREGKRVYLTTSSDWIGGYHPMVQRSIGILRPFFQEYAVEDEIMATERVLNRVLQMLPNTHNIREEVANDWQSSNNVFKSLIKACSGHSDKIVDEIILEMLYPRLDENVTKGFNHLLKSPFCVHPKTGRICVPLDAEEIRMFNPDEVPTVADLLKELQDANGDIRQTSFGKHLAIFEKFVENIGK